MLSLALFSIGYCGALRESSKVPAAIGRLIVASTNALLLLTFAVAEWWTSEAFLAAYAIANTFGATALLYRLHTTLPKVQRVRRTQRARLWTAFGRFPAFATWSALINTLSQNLPIYALAIYFSDTSVGLLALAMRAFQLPASTIGKAISQASLSITGSQANLAHSGDIANRIVTQTAQLLAFPLLFVTLNGRWLFALAFGEEWSTAGCFAQILGVGATAKLVAAPLTSLLVTARRQRIELFWNALLLAGRLLGLTIGVCLASTELALLGYSIFSAIAYMALTAIVLSQCDGDSHKTWLHLGKILVFAAIASLPSAIASELHDSLLLPLLVAACCAAVYYYGTRERLMGALK